MSLTGGPPQDDLPAPATKLFVKSFISEKKGFGLKASSRIEAGTMIIHERIIVVSAEQRVKSVMSPREYNQLIANKVKAVGGNEFAREFMKLPNNFKDSCKGFKNIFGGVVETCHFPANLDDVPAAVVGLDSAYLNHGCIPNVVVSFQTPADLYGVHKADHPDEFWLAVHACIGINQGDEIVAAYTHLNANTAQRRARIKGFFKFDCVCDDCVKADPNLERFMDVYGKIERTIIHPNIMENEPAAALKAAYDLGIGLIGARIFDYRFASLWEQCAVICAWHSDQGRALYFLGRAQAAYERIEGEIGRNFKRIGAWRNDITSMPTYGTTTRGLSSRLDAKALILNQKREPDILFMLGANAYEYVRLSDYHGIVGQDEHEVFGWYKRWYKRDLEESAKEDEQPQTAEQLQALVDELDAEKKEYDEERLGKSKPKNKNKSKKKKGKR